MKRKNGIRKKLVNKNEKLIKKCYYSWRRLMGSQIMRSIGYWDQIFPG
jgi:hypothetical protein